MTELRHGELTYALRGLIFETQDKLKPGWSEEIYHRGLLQTIQQNNLQVQSKLRSTIVHRGVAVHTFECDLLVGDRVILELKALPFTNFAPAHYTQLISYLKCWHKDLGLLVNFGSVRPQIERIVWDEPQWVLHEDYDAIQDNLAKDDEVYLDQIKQGIVMMGQQYGLGYPDTLYRKILAIELTHSGMPCQSDVTVRAELNGKILGNDPSDHLLVADRYLLNIRALLAYPSKYEFARTKNFLNRMGLQLGLIVNFGKKHLQIFAVNPD